VCEVRLDSLMSVGLAWKYNWGVFMPTTLMKLWLKQTHFLIYNRRRAKKNKNNQINQPGHKNDHSSVMEQSLNNMQGTRE